MGKQTISYERVMEPRRVEFICQRCGKPATRLMYPGPKPKYCDECRTEVDAEQNRANQARRRAKLKAQSSR